MEDVVKLLLDKIKDLDESLMKVLSNRAQIRRAINLLDPNTPVSHLVLRDKDEAEASYEAEFQEELAREQEMIAAAVPVTKIGADFEEPRTIAVGTIADDIQRVKKKRRANPLKFATLDRSRKSAALSTIVGRVESTKINKHLVSVGYAAKVGSVIRPVDARIAKFFGIGSTGSAWFYTDTLGELLAEVGYKAEHITFKSL